MNTEHYKQQIADLKKQLTEAQEEIRKIKGGTVRYIREHLTVKGKPYVTPMFADVVYQNLKHAQQLHWNRTRIVRAYVEDEEVK